jgi:hypothetical protein
MKRALRCVVLLVLAGVLAGQSFAPLYEPVPQTPLVADSR